MCTCDAKKANDSSLNDVPRVRPESLPPMFPAGTRARAAGSAFQPFEFRCFARTPSVRKRTSTRTGQPRGTKWQGPGKFAISSLQNNAMRLYLRSLSVYAYAAAFSACLGPCFVGVLFQLFLIFYVFLCRCVCATCRELLAWNKQDRLSFSLRTYRQSTIPRASPRK